MVMQKLKKLDTIAYIRFASVYRDFADITVLKKEIDSLVSPELGTEVSTSQLPLLPAEELAVSGRRQRIRK